MLNELNIPVLCYGLRTDFRGELFPGSEQLLAWADDLPWRRWAAVYGDANLRAGGSLLGGGEELYEHGFGAAFSGVHRDVDR